MNRLVLLGAGHDPLALLLVVIFIVVPLLGALASKLREVLQPPNPLPPLRNDKGRIQEQIDEFLRRAAQRRGGPQPAEAPQPAEIVEEDDAPIGGRVGQQVQTYLDTSEFRRRSEELGGEVVQSDQQFTQKVQQAFSGEVSRLASRPGEAARPLEVVAAEAAEPEYLSRPTLDALPEAGSGLADFLGSPENIAQAVVMSEILRRPE